jgi:hypothetical protein
MKEKEQGPAAHDDQNVSPAGLGGSRGMLWVAGWLMSRCCMVCVYVCWVLQALRQPTVSGGGFAPGRMYDYGDK